MHVQNALPSCISCDEQPAGLHSMAGLTECLGSCQARSRQAAAWRAELLPHLAEQLGLDCSSVACCRSHTTCRQRRELEQLGQ